MNKSGGPPSGPWSQPSPRKEQVEEVAGLDPEARRARLMIGHGVQGHIDDEVVVTLLLQAWKSGSSDAEGYATELLRRVLKQVKAHVAKNKSWQLRGGGSKAVVDDFCQEIVESILTDKASPCHAERAFGNYVYRRCLDEAAKFYAKKRSAGQSFDDSGMVEAEALHSDAVDLPAHAMSPEEQLEQEFEALERQLTEEVQLERIREIVQLEMPEKPQLAFTFRFYGELPIESKDPEEITVSRLMGCSEKSVSNYIRQAKKIILEKMS
jgi:RNA polymerase sigma factor (sigma-70 family)